MISTIAVEEHGLLRVGGFVTEFSSPVGQSPAPARLLALLRLDADAPLSRDEDARTAVRDMLRLRGYKPTGRGKPASEYLVRAAEQGLASINAAVDACNAVSLHSGLPISVIDLERAQPPFRIAACQERQRYAFNVSGQEIDLGGLLCLHDAEGPCANAVKDSQRTKTDEHTVTTLSVLWGCAAHEERLADAVRWYREILEALNATTRSVAFEMESGYGG